MPQAHRQPNPQKLPTLLPHQQQQVPQQQHLQKIEDAGGVGIVVDETNVSKLELLIEELHHG